MARTSRYSMSASFGMFMLSALIVQAAHGQAIILYTEANSISSRSVELRIWDGPLLLQCGDYDEERFGLFMANSATDASQCGPHADYPGLSGNAWGHSLTSINVDGDEITIASNTDAHGSTVQGNPNIEFASAVGHSTCYSTVTLRLLDAMYVTATSTVEAHLSESPGGGAFSGSSARVQSTLAPSSTLDVYNNGFATITVGPILRPAGTYTCEVTVIATAHRAAGQNGASGTDLASATAMYHVVFTPVVGACCLPSGECEMLRASECQSRGGTYRGSSVACNPIECRGPCCLLSGACQEVSGTRCAELGGQFRGYGYLCADEQCAGACCSLDGTCAMISFEGCAAQNGEYSGDGVFCTASICVGACCLPDGHGCRIESQSACNAAGGNYTGGGTRCCFAGIDCGGDNDGDGIPDCWESEFGGVDGDGDGTPDLDLYHLGQPGHLGGLISARSDRGLGARPDRKDLFVEVDLAAGMTFPPAAQDLVIKAFAKSPVDGGRGINLHILTSENNLDIGPGEDINPTHGFPISFDSLGGGTNNGLKSQHFGQPGDSPARRAAKALVFRYNIVYMSVLPNGRFNTYNGIAEILGDDFILCFDNPIFHGADANVEKAATFMHELGHTLGLYHGGTIDGIDSLGRRFSHQGKPNYLSVMNYVLTHPLPFSRAFWKLDYSREQLPTLNEARLDEEHGIRAAPRYSRWSMPFGTNEPSTCPNGSVSTRRIRYVRMTGVPTDFDRDDNEHETCPSDPQATCPAQDLNWLGACAPIPQVGDQTPGDIMPGHDDWSNLVFGNNGIDNFVDGVHNAGEDVSEFAAEPSVELDAWIEATFPIPPLYGDVNCDLAIDGADIAPFVTLLLDPQQFGSQFPGCDPTRGDLNGDGSISSLDVPAFQFELLRDDLDE